MNFGNFGVSGHPGQREPQGKWGGFSTQIFPQGSP